MGTLCDLSVTYIKDHKRDLIKQFANPDLYPSVQNPVSFFMAGSPGTGKTETSKVFIEDLENNDPGRKIVRIDADEVRDFIPYYDHKNASEIQLGAGLGVAKLLDFVFERKMDFLLDGTFADYRKSHSDVERCIRHNRKIAIIYLYLEPNTAWEFTKKREALEGRHVPKEFFINTFFKAKENVNLIKKEFGDSVELHLYIKRSDQSIDKTYFNVDNIDTYLKITYTLQELEKLI